MMGLSRLGGRPSTADSNSILTGEKGTKKSAKKENAASNNHKTETEENDEKTGG